LRITKDEALENRTRIVAAAARLFREKGFDGVGVADLMQAAGLTHGGFYNHFASKEALAAAACDLAFEGAVETLERSFAGASSGARKAAFAAYVENYLSAKARDASAARCPIVALTNDAVRQGPGIRRRFASGVRHYLDTLSAAFAPRDKKRARSEAITALALMIGGLLLARGVKEGDLALSDEILATVKSAIAARL
jgi:TetR/AcrR family transcriptional repressor of nem operon